MGLSIRGIVRKIKENQDFKTLVANFGYLSLLKIASFIFPFITLPYLAKTIGADGFGKIAFAAAVIAWFQTVADWGFNYTATRDVAKNRDNKDVVSDIFSRVFFSRCLLMLASFVVLFLCTLFIPKLAENRAILFVTFLLIPGHIMFPDWFFQAIERMKYVTIFNILVKLFFTIAVFIFIKEKSDYIIQPLLTSIGYIVVGIISMYMIMSKWGVKLKMQPLKSLFNTIKQSTDVFLNNLMPNLYHSFSVMLLGFYGGDVATGKLDAGNKFVAASQQLMDIISRVFFPFLSRKIDKHNLYIKIHLGLSLFLTVVLFLFAPLLIKLFFTEEFYDSIAVLRIMSIGIFFLALTVIYGTNYLIIMGKEKQLRNITFSSSIIGFAMSFPLIYFFNFIGAALTITITRGILGIRIMLRARKIKNS
ncbi:MAG: flippase [Bacteroidales bacterium]|nr:flippase [Bacteroidales bacterium]